MDIIVEQHLKTFDSLKNAFRTHDLRSMLSGIKANAKEFMLNTNDRLKDQSGNLRNLEDTIPQIIHDNDSLGKM